MAAIADEPASPEPPRGRPSTATLVHLRHARDLIDRGFDQPLDLDALAAEAGFSRYHFARSFRSAFGETPRAYLTRRRIERAKQLLAAANLTVTEVCHLVGFQSLGSFSSRFSELVGRSPSAYRDATVQRGGPPPVPGCFVLAWARPTGDPGTRHRTPDREPTAGSRASGRTASGEKRSDGGLA